MVFVCKTVVNVRNKASINGEVVGQIGAGQEVPVDGQPLVVDGWIWRSVAESNKSLWIAERSLDGRNVLLEAKLTSPQPQTVQAAPQVQTTVQPQAQPATVQSSTGSVPSLPANVDIDPKDYYRTFRASLGITRAFEGGGFASYNNYDRGIVSYGIVQFTLSSGSLIKVLDSYLSTATSGTAQALKNDYAARYRSKDQALRNDARFKELLTAAAQEKPMQDAQYQVAISDYWEVVIRNYVVRRGNIRLPLTYALFFDMGIHFGVNHSFVRRAEEALGVPSNSRPGANGITEQQLASKVAELRRESHNAQAARDNLPGLRVRGDFWFNLTQSGDWFLQGDDKGLVYPKSGVSVQVRNPV